MISPEETGQYTCPECGNTREFTGYDDRGNPGPDECTCGRTECICNTTLTQSFTVVEGADIRYQAFKGGGRGTEIGPYTRIQCAACGALIWTEARESDTTR